MDIFKNLTSLENRTAECNRIITKHPGRVPVVVCKGCNDISLPDIDKHKFLVPKDMTIGQFVYIIRKRIKLDPNHALFVLINNTLQPTNKSLDDIYLDNKDEDGYLYIIYSSENTFG
jgi:GABA(A) receptor-associated protein|tara:strand:- start:171 stop:521 length:351 start_codon:yes stop_codon:yes gene_type:complete